MTECRICKFFQSHPHKVSEEFFEQKAREGIPLRQLSLLLESYGLKVSKDLVSKHIRECLPSEIREQRQAEKEHKAKESKSVFKGIEDFFRPKKEKCEHLRTMSYFDMGMERVIVQCKDCGMRLYDYDSEQEERNQRRNSERCLRILKRLEEERKMF